MALIVNLSAIHTRPSIDAVVDAFARLHYRHAKPICCWPSMVLSKLWVKYLYARHYGLINEYKLGQVTTQQFLARVLPAFDFLGHDDAAKQSFIQAWNAIVQFDQHDFDKFQNLVENAKTQKIYFISNTNELNVEKILTELRNANFDILLPEEINLSLDNINEPVKIADNMYLYLSYQVGSCKTEEANQRAGRLGTPGLLKLLIDKLHDEGEKEIQVISQYDGDTEEAKKIASQEKGLVIHPRKAEEYFQTNAPEAPLKRKEM